MTPRTLFLPVFLVIMVMAGIFLPVAADTVTTTTTTPTVTTTTVATTAPTTTATTVATTVPTTVVTTTATTVATTTPVTTTTTAVPLVPVAGFSATPTSGTVPLTVQFTDTSTNSPTIWVWSFGDGNSSTLENPANTYVNAGTYTVTLTAIKGAESNVITRSSYITTTSAPVASAPVAAFTATPASGSVPLTVQFTDTSTNSPTTWNWTFGDGNTSTLQNPSFTYTTAGSYTVTLTAANSIGSASFTQTVTVNSVGTVPPTASFSATPVSGSVPLTVQFTDTSADFPTTWNWTFGDGNTSTLQNPSFTYTTSGSYTVSLTVTNALGSDVSSETGYISVDAAATAPVASFSGDPSSGTAPLSVEFTDTSANSPTTWTWDFGDGGTSTLEEPTHTYTTAGTYTVSLTAANTAGSNTSIWTNYIGVSAAAGPVAQSTFAPVSTPTSTPALPDVSFDGTPTSGAAPLTVQFTGKSSGTPDSWAWDFGDGGTSSEQDPSYTYTIPGTYTVTLTAKYPEYEVPSTQTNYITVGGGTASSQAPLPPFTVIGAIGLVVIFSASVSGRKKQ